MFKRRKFKSQRLNDFYEWSREIFVKFCAYFTPFKYSARQKNKASIGEMILIEQIARTCEPIESDKSTMIPYEYVEVDLHRILKSNSMSNEAKRQIAKHESLAAAASSTSKDEIKIYGVDINSTRFKLK